MDYDFTDGVDWAKKNYGTKILALYNKLKSKLPAQKVKFSATLNLHFKAEDLLSTKQQSHHHNLLVNNQNISDPA